jgi:hypothetical protein
MVRPASRVPTVRPCPHGMDPPAPRSPDARPTSPGSGAGSSMTLRHRACGGPGPPCAPADPPAVVLQRLHRRKERSDGGPGSRFLAAPAPNKGGSPELVLRVHRSREDGPGLPPCFLRCRHGSTRRGGGRAIGRGGVRAAGAARPGWWHGLSARSCPEQHGHLRGDPARPGGRPRPGGPARPEMRHGRRPWHDHHPTPPATHPGTAHAPRESEDRGPRCGTPGLELCRRIRPGPEPRRCHPRARG